MKVSREEIYRRDRNSQLLLVGLIPLMLLALPILFFSLLANLFHFGIIYMGLLCAYIIYFSYYIIRYQYFLSFGSNEIILIGVNNNELISKLNEYGYEKRDEGWFFEVNGLWGISIILNEDKVFSIPEKVKGYNFTPIKTFISGTRWKSYGRIMDKKPILFWYYTQKPYKILLDTIRKINPIYAYDITFDEEMEIHYQ